MADASYAEMKSGREAEQIQLKQGKKIPLKTQVNVAQKGGVKP